jgi:hypothetical protein
MLVSVLRTAPARRSDRVDIGPAAILVVALGGAWLSHSLEYLRVWGAHRFVGAALSSVHLYVGPVGVVLLAAGAIGVQSTARLGRRLERHLRELRRPGAGRPQPDGSGSTGWSFSLPTLVAVVWLLQLGLYLIQENGESVLARAPARGLGALAGPHALAPLVHLAVALVLVTGVFLVRRRVTHLARAVRAAAGRVRAGRPVAPARPVTSGRTWTPAERWGAQRWCRPPPVAVGSHP